MAADAQANIKRMPVRRTAWKALEAHYKRIRELHLRLVCQRPTRGQR
jgi:hypothetical protein